MHVVVDLTVYVCVYVYVGNDKKQLSLTYQHVNTCCLVRIS